jgi:hypothetical protein
MSAADGANKQHEALLDIGLQAQQAEQFSPGIVAFAEAILLKSGVEPPDGYGNYRLPRYFDRKTGYVTSVAEVVIPREIFGWHVQRVRVDQLVVGRHERQPGLYITEQYRAGAVTAIAVGAGEQRRMQIWTHHPVTQVETRNVDTARDVCSVMNLAAHRGVTVPAHRIGRRTMREYAQTAGAYFGYAVVKLATEGIDGFDW